MGYQVDHLGRFAVDPPLPPDVRAWIDEELLDDPWAAAEERGLPLDLDSHCTWWTGGEDGDGSYLEWTGAEKAYDGYAWLTWLLEHVLEPAGHTVDGHVWRFAEPEHGVLEASSIHCHPPGVHGEGLYEDDAFDSATYPWTRQPDVPDDAPSIGDALFELTSGDPEVGQELLVGWLAVVPLGDHPLVSWLEDTASFWPDPVLVHTAVAASARARTPRARRPERPRRRGLFRRRGDDD